MKVQPTQSSFGEPAYEEIRGVRYALWKAPDRQPDWLTPWWHFAAILAGFFALIVLQMLLILYALRHPDRVEVALYLVVALVLL